MPAHYREVAVIGAIILASSMTLPAFSIGAEITAQLEYIGTATMNPDGTIVLHLTRTADGTPADAVLAYPPGDPQYDEVLRHLGGLTPRESKLVPPWADG